LEKHILSFQLGAIEDNYEKNTLITFN